MKHLLTIALLVAALSVSKAQNCNIVMIDDYCTMINDDFARYEFDRHEPRESVYRKMQHLKLMSNDSLAIVYLANCKDMLRLFTLHFVDDSLKMLSMLQKTNKKTSKDFYLIAIQNVQMYYVNDIKLVEGNKTYFDNECYTVIVSEEKKQIRTDILMK